MKFRRFVSDDSGMALIASLGVVLVVSALSLVTFSMSFHNLDESATNRERIQSIAAAEAGINRMFALLETVTPETIQCSVTETLTTDPNSSFLATLYADNGAGGVTQMTCPPASIPSQILIRSVGKALGPVPERTMESLVNMVPIEGTLFGAYAIYSDDDLDIDSNVQVLGNDGADADIYSNGSIDLNSNVVVSGTAHSQDEILLNSNAEVKKDVWALNRVELDSNSIVRRNVTSSTSSVTVLSDGHIYGDARAGTSITAGGSAIDGVRIPNSPSGPPPQRPFPAFTFNAADWQSIGYTVQTFTSCTDAKTFIQGIASGNYVVRITSSCELSWGGNSTINVRGNLAIISNGAFKLDSNAKFTAVGGPHELYFIVGLAGTGACNFSMQSNTSIGPNFFSLIYSPCDVILSSNAFVVDGQVFAGQAFFNSNTSLTYRPLQGPGGVITGYRVEPLYTREVRNS